MCHFDPWHVFNEPIRQFCFLDLRIVWLVEGTLFLCYLQPLNRLCISTAASRRRLALSSKHSAVVCCHTGKRFSLNNVYVEGSFLFFLRVGKRIDGSQIRRASSVGPKSVGPRIWAPQSVRGLSGLNSVARETWAPNPWAPGFEPPNPWAPIAKWIVVSQIRGARSVGPQSVGPPIS